MADAVIALEIVAGSRPFDAAADVDGDGGCNQDMQVFLLFSGNVGLYYATTTAIMEHCRSKKSFTPTICVHLR
ncbi:MAG: hypothetical protein U9Q68_04765 [Euryarchaeota archaeon]|nr:hypothetical protein [Euryarchaeota archaeon]